MKKIKSGIGVLFFLILSLNIYAADEPTEEQLLKVLITDNENVISESKVATFKAKKSIVKSYADYMIKADSNILLDLKNIEKKLGLRPAISTKSFQVKKKAFIATKKLLDLSGDEFDKAYMELQIVEHRRVLDHLDYFIMPVVKNKILKETFAKKRNEIARHLEVAKKVKSKI